MFEVEPLAQETLDIQSKRQNLAVLVTLYPDNRIPWRNLQSKVALILSNVPGTTLSTAGSFLEEKGLLEKRESRTARFALTNEGRASVEAFQAYRAILLPEMIAVRLQKSPHTATIKQEQIANLPKNYHPEAALLRLMAIHGDAKRMTILQTLSAEPDQPIGFKQLQRAIASILETNIPGSTLSNLNVQIERELLIKRASTGEVSITTLGVKSLKAFKLYQDTLGWSTTERNRKQLLSDFGDIITFNNQR